MLGHKSGGKRELRGLISCLVVQEACNFNPSRELSVTLRFSYPFGPRSAQIPFFRTTEVQVFSAKNPGVNGGWEVSYFGWWCRRHLISIPQGNSWELWYLVHFLTLIAKKSLESSFSGGPNITTYLSQRNYFGNYYCFRANWTHGSNNLRKNIFDAVWNLPLVDLSAPVADVLPFPGCKIWFRPNW